MNLEATVMFEMSVNIYSFIRTFLVCKKEFRTLEVCNLSFLSTLIRIRVKNYLPRTLTKQTLLIMALKTVTYLLAQAYNDSVEEIADNATGFVHFTLSRVHQEGIIC